MKTKSQDVEDIIHSIQDKEIRLEISRIIHNLQDSLEQEKRKLQVTQGRERYYKITAGLMSLVMIAVIYVCTNQ